MWWKASAAVREKKGLLVFCSSSQESVRENKKRYLLILTIGFKDSAGAFRFSLCCLKDFTCDAIAVERKISTSITCHSVVIKQSF